MRLLFHCHGTIFGFFRNAEKGKGEAPLGSRGGGFWVSKQKKKARIGAG